MRKQILTDNETKAFLIKTFQCSRQAVWQALTFQRNSDQARRIRHLALQRGGKLTDGYAPKCETSYEEGEKTMTQRFGSRVKIVEYSETGNVSVFVDDRLKENYENLDVCSLMQLQSEVEQMAAVL